MAPLPRIILTSGEPAGIGPDLCLKIAQLDWACELIVAGDPPMLQERASQLELPLTFETYQAGDSPAAHRAGTVRVLGEPLAQTVVPGHLNPANAGYVLRLLERAVDGCLNGSFQAMVTAPVQKSVINDAGIAFTGHTEFLAERTGAPLPVMLLVAEHLRVALATTHLPLRRVPDSLTVAGLVAVLRVVDSDLRKRFGFARPRISVCGLNPHAGEGGHLGSEDAQIVAPAIEQARREGINAAGPIPADTAFTPRSLAAADVVLALYHDQGLPVLKYAGFGHAVNITLGLPIIRTSVDHGTALALAGSGQADSGSLSAALVTALELVAAGT